MKTPIIIIIFLALNVSVIAQRRISTSYTEINRTQFESCINAVYLITNTQINKVSGKLTIPIYDRTPKVFKDDISDEIFHEFEYLGDIIKTKLSIVKRTGYNSEDYFIVNHLTGSVDTLIGIPVFAQNMRDFACINNPGTDEKQQLQVCEITNGVIKTRVFLKSMGDTYLEEISCINRNSISIKGKNGIYWRLNFITSNE